ncbi:MAG: hypothetical protein KGJ80_13160 [Chloroflexota bacterium]|nr:hypothetical protein [Chloroflexota bacterium]
MSFPDRRAYEELVYGTRSTFPSIRHSTLVLATIGPTLAKLEGQISFAGEMVLDVWELIDLDAQRILNYSYEVYRAGEKIVWYDPFEHPHVPELASTHPHHKHVLPDIKHNRVPALDISFTEPNLPYLIAEIEREHLP